MDNSDKMPDKLIDELHSNIQSIYDTDGWYVDTDGEGSNEACVSLQSALAAVEEFENDFKSAHQELLEKALEPYREAMQEFVDRCERGEVRSKYTYKKFLAILNATRGEDHE